MESDARRRRWLGAWGAVAVSAVALAGVTVAGTGTGTGTVPVPEAGGAHVEAVFPTADRLPANLLRFYIVFSAPMSSGEAHARLRLVDDRGNAVAGAFLELEEELWDPTGRRLTVLLDPGRIKRGLRANLESGAPLVEGRGYRLEVDAGWRDAQGRPLGRGHVKPFLVGLPDRTSPDVGTWRLAPPVPGTRAPLVLLFPDPLDRALLASALTIADPRGAVVEGTIEVTTGEREWRFTPRAPWAIGRHELRVAAELEDVAGNNLDRVFDVDLSRTGRAPAGPPTRVRPFTIGPDTVSRSGS